MQQGVGPATPTWQRHWAIPPRRFRLIPFRSPLLRESQLLSVPQGTEMFQFPWFPLPVLCVQTGVTPHDGCRVSPFGHPRINAWLAAPRGLSQPPTSFIGVRRQGIHRWLFVAWKNKDARARYAVLKELGGDRVPAPDMRTPAQPLGGRAGGASRNDGQRPLPQNRRQDSVSGTGSIVRRWTPSTNDVAWTRPNEAPTGSRPCGVQEQ